MFPRSIIVSLLVFVISTGALAVNAPITTSPVITTATAGTAAAPVTVKNFIDIGSFTLTLRYRSTSLSFVSCSVNGAFSGATVTTSVVSGTVNKIVVTWTGTAGVTLPDQTALFTVTFTYISGTSTLSWDVSTGATCQYKKYDSGAFTLMNDTPKSSFYINGGISNRGAPVTYAPVMSSMTTGNFSLPVLVRNFSSIGAVSLELEYDSTVLAYQNSYVLNPAVGGTFLVSNSVNSFGKKCIRCSWFGSSLSLADGSTLISFTFSYSPASGTWSYLNWNDTAPSTCEYTDNGGNVLLDAPVQAFYKNGTVFKGTTLSPAAWLPAVGNAAAGALAVPLKTRGFANVGSFSLAFEYDPSVMTYSSFTANPSLGGTMNVTDNPPVNGKRKLAVDWSGSSQSLSDSSTLVTLNFTYISGATALAFVTDGASCRFNDGNGKAYYDLPEQHCYLDGYVTFHAAPHTIGWYATPSPGTQVTVPVKVTNFSNIGSADLTVDYDPGVMTYQGASLVPAIGGTFTPTLTQAGRLTLAWSGTAATLADSSTLFNLTFNYSSGGTPLAWYDNGTSCKYAEGAGQPALYDQPLAMYYVNGWVGPNPLLADFTADYTLLPVNGSSCLGDLTSGGPASYNYTASPATVCFVSNTYSGSQYPILFFPVNGGYTVTLKTSRGVMYSTKTRTEYIHVGTSGLWTGITSSDWSTSSNWHNWLVPDNTISVTIPSSAPDWPVLAGNLTTGVQAKNITLNSNAQLTVNGNITLSPGYVLTMGNNSLLSLTGDWSNTGVFTPGTGSVEFTGGSSSSVLNTSSQVSWLANYSVSSFAAGMSAISGGTAGPTGDNAHSDVPIGFPFSYLGTTYASVRINTNGWLSFNLSGDDGTSGDNARLFSTSVPNTTLGPWWDDLAADGSSAIGYVTTGSSPDRVFTAEWKNILSYSSGATTRLNFQVKLYESSGIIEFCYGTVAGGSHNASESASAGIEDATGGTGHFREATTGSMTTGVTNLTSTSNWPAVNYRFTPPPLKETFYNLIETKEGATLTIQKDIVVEGELIVK